MQQSLTLNIKNIDDNININRNKTVNLDIKDNNISKSINKIFPYENHKVHRICHDYLISPKSLYIIPNINQKERKKKIYQTPSERLYKKNIIQRIPKNQSA